MLTFCALGSGSSGNCSYISDGENSLLLDAGFSAKEILRRLKIANLDPASIDAIVVSHEHSDHLRGVGVTARRLNVPIYINRGAYEKAKHVIGDKVRINHFTTGDKFNVASIGVDPFSIAHDAADPAAFVFSNRGQRLAHVTDVGSVTLLLKKRIADIDYLVIEANHEPEMLQAGPYPWPLKQRIASRTGHLSNPDCARLLSDVIHANLQGVTFAHLSEINNMPAMVTQIAEQVLGDIPHHVAAQGTPGPVVRVE